MYQSLPFYLLLLYLFIYLSGVAIIRSEAWVNCVCPAGLICVGTIYLF